MKFEVANYDFMVQRFSYTTSEILHLLFDVLHDIYVVSWEERDTQWNRVNNLLTEVVQSNKYKSRAVGVTSEVGLTTD